jgi:hypothetical protein
MEAHALR